MNNDLISRSALLAELQALKTLAKGPAQERLIRRQLYAVGHAPAVDAVPVVRCKDCKWWESSKRGAYCSHLTSGLFTVDKSGDDFCSYGERREDG